MVLTLFISGLLSGSLYALMALALSLSYRSSGVSNFAQGDSATLGAYLLLLMSSSWQWSLWLALPLVLLAAFAIGWLTERLLRPIPAEDHLKSVILTLGIQIFLFGLISSIWGPEQQALPILDDGTVLQISSWQFNRGDILSILIALSLMLGLGLVLRYSRLGIMISASQQNPKAANLWGIQVSKMRALSFGISGIIGCVAALLISPLLSLDPAMMWEPLLKGFCAAILGGLRSLRGAVIGGVLLGLSESFFGFYVSLPYKSLLALVFVILALWLRPQGLTQSSYASKL